MCFFPYFPHVASDKKQTNWGVSVQKVDNPWLWNSSTFILWNELQVAGVAPGSCSSRVHVAILTRWCMIELFTSHVLVSTSPPDGPQSAHSTRDASLHLHTTVKINRFRVKQESDTIKHTQHWTSLLTELYSHGRGSEWAESPGGIYCSPAVPTWALLCRAPGS